MRGLKQGDTESIVCKEANLPAPKMTLLEKLYHRVGKHKQRRIGKKIETGRLPHGRVGEVSGNLGVSAVTANTLLQVRHFRGDKEIADSYREVHNRVVTNAGRDAIVDAFTGTFTLSSFNYHDCGTGTAAEAVGNTALGTAVSEARVAGTQSQPTSDVYQSVGEFTFGNAYAITEHGLFSQTAKPGGVLLDRTVFGAINVVSGDKISFTFTLTVNAGG